MSPSTVQGAPGDTINVGVVVNNTIGLNGYLVEFRYDHTMLSAIGFHALNVSNVWVPPPPPASQAWTNMGCSTGNSYDSSGTRIANSTATACIPLTKNGSNGIGTGDPTCPGTIATSQFDGCIAESQVLLGAITNVTGTTGETLFSVDFKVLAAGSSPVVLLKAFLFGTDLGPDFMLGADSGGLRQFLAATYDGMVFGIGSADIIKSGVNPAFHHLSISRNGNVQTLTALVGNTGTVNVYVRVGFTIVSESGDVSFVGTGVLLLPPPSKTAASGVLSAAFTVPPLPMRYHVIGILMTSADGIHFVLAGSTSATQYSVVP